MKLKKKNVCQYCIYDPEKESFCSNEESENFNKTKIHDICKKCGDYKPADVNLTLHEALHIVLENIDIFPAYKGADKSCGVMMCSVCNNNDEVIKFLQAMTVLRIYDDCEYYPNNKNEKSDTLGEIVKNARERHHLSQRELADEIKISNATISRIEKTDDPIRPHPDTLRKIAKRLSLDYSELMILCGYINKS